MSTPATLPNLVSRARSATTPLNLHIAGVVALLALNIYLAVHLFLSWSAAQSSSGNAVAQQQIALRAAEIAAQPLRGLDTKITNSSADADKFTDNRLPKLSSTVYDELGVLAKKNNVRLSRVQYTPAVPEDLPNADLTEIRMDATLTGDYRPLVQFVNAIERDKLFFVINSVTFTGQSGSQGGGTVVNLRVRLTTYLRQPISAVGGQKEVAR